jgi:hypothetical protein
VVRVKVYVEGGGDTRQQQSGLRRAFAQFIEETGLGGNMPRVIACGSRSTAFDDFKTGHKEAETVAILLVDSEEPVTADSPWHHLQRRDGWIRPPDTEDDQCHLMVQVMESWFLADREALAAYYGSDFRSSAIPQWPEIEGIPKVDVLSGLHRATRNTTKGSYRKGRHGFEILGRLDPNKVTTASLHAKRFVDSLKKFGASHG